jgi:hypothetical protein
LQIARKAQTQQQHTFHLVILQGLLQDSTTSDPSLQLLSPSDTAAVILLLCCYFYVTLQGGANAGHTIYDENGTKYALHLLPSGVLNK